MLFLWLAFGGPVPLKPKGYRVTASFAEASQLATEADVRISGVPVGKVKAIEPDAETGRADRDDRARRQVRAAAVGRPGDPAPEDAAGGDLRRADARHARTRRSCRRAAGCAEGSVSETVELDEILRTFDPRTREAFQQWMQTQAQAIAGHGRDLNDALGNLGPFAEDAAELVDILNRQEPAVRRLIANTGVVFEALTERDGQLRDLIENSNRVFATTASRDRELQEAFVALPTFERESRETIDAADAVRARHRPAGHAAAPGRARALADAAGPVGARAGPRGAVPRASTR